jgi:hypothetical protein
MAAFERQRDATLVRQSASGSPESVRSRGSECADMFPLLGRICLPGSSVAGGRREAGRAYVAVVSYELWNGRFGASASFIGSQITLTISAPCRLPSSVSCRLAFSVPGTPAQLWTPLSRSQARVTTTAHGLFECWRDSRLA